MMPSRQVNRAALADAERALILLDEAIQEGGHGDVEGIDTVDAGLDAMASALARLFAFPEARGAKGPDIEEVLSYLVSMKRVEPEVLAAAQQVAEGVKRARYQPLRDEEVQRMEGARGELYGELEALLSEVEEEGSDG